MPVFCLLTACGFHPVYGAHDNDTPVADELNQVAIENIADRQGQMLRNDLIDRMYGKGRPHNPKYHLETKLRSTEESIGILPDSTTTLTELNLFADYSLKDETGKELVHATAHAVATFNQLTQEYGTLAARDNAYQRCIDEAGEQIVNRISLYFSEKTIIAPPAPTNPVPIPGLTPGVTR